MIIDSTDRFGGAWYSDTSPGGNEIECGCHIWSYDPEVYNYIERDLGVQLSTYKPNAVFVSKRLKVPYSIKNSIDSYKYLLKNLVTFNMVKLKGIKSNPVIRFRLIGKKNKYPKKGSPVLINELARRLNALDNISFVHNVQIDKIVTDKNIELIHSGGSFIGKEVYMTSVSKLQSVSSAEKTINITPRQVDYIHFLFQTDRPLRKKVSYWRFTDDEVIHRITDISYQTNNTENLFLVGIKPEPFSKYDEEELEKKILATMDTYGIIDDAINVERIKTHVYPTFYIEIDVRKEIDDIHPQLHLLHSTDIMYGYHYLLAEEGLI